MMNRTGGWVGEWMGGGMWVWTAVGILVVILLAVVIGKLFQK
jgi:heme exporter protein D